MVLTISFLSHSWCCSKTTVSIEVSYLASTDRDILIIFQRIALRGLSLEKRELQLVQVALRSYSCSY